jgi:hypothetical protein
MKMILLATTSLLELYFFRKGLKSGLYILWRMYAANKPSTYNRSTQTAHPTQDTNKFINYYYQS